MKEFPISSLAQIINATPVENTGIFTGVSIDSRTIIPGDCFFAIPGENFDGHDYVAGALEKGAACAVVSKDIDDKKSTDNLLLKVPDSIKALGDLAREYRRKAGYKVVAITGSAGKTTTRQITYQALSQNFLTHQSPKSFNNNIGLPLTLLSAPPNCHVVIAELGSNHPGEIAHLTRIAEPDIALVTNVHPAHLEGFGSLQTIINEKSSISEGLAPDGVLIINADFEQLVSTCRKKELKFLTFGKSDNADYQALNIKLETASSQFTINDTQIHLPLAGPGNLENALAAWTICSQFNMNVNDFAQAVSKISPVSMRTELLQVGTLTILSDCYNANPASMKNALEILTGLDPTRKRRLVFICGEMAELCKHSETLHNELGTSIARTNIELLITVGKFAEITADVAKTTSKQNQNSPKPTALQIKCFKDSISICNNLHEFIKDYDIILVKGSRSARLETVIDKIKETFS